MSWGTWVAAGGAGLAVAIALYIWMAKRKNARLTDLWYEEGKRHFYQCRHEQPTRKPVDLLTFTPWDVRAVATAQLARKGLDPEKMNERDREAALDSALEEATSVGAGRPGSDRRRRYDAMLARSVAITGDPESEEVLTRAGELILHTPVAELCAEKPPEEEKWASILLRAIGNLSLGTVVDAIPSVLDLDGASEDFEADALLRLHVASETFSARFGLWQLEVFRAMAGVPQNRDEEGKGTGPDFESVMRQAKSAKADRVGDLVRRFDRRAKEELFFEQLGARENPEPYLKSLMPAVWAAIATERLSFPEALRFALSFGLTPEGLGLGQGDGIKRRFEQLRPFWALASIRYEAHLFTSTTTAWIRTGKEDELLVGLRYQTYDQPAVCEARRLDDQVWLMKDIYPTVRRSERPSGRSYYLLFCGAGERPAAIWELEARDSVDLAQIALSEGTQGGHRKLHLSFGPMGGGGTERWADIAIDESGTARLLKAQGAMSLPAEN